MSPESQSDPFPFAVTQSGCPTPPAVDSVFEQEKVTLGDLVERVIPAYAEQIERCDAALDAVHEWGRIYEGDQTSDSSATGPGPE